MSQEYYTPDIEDLRVGYECEAMQSNIISNPECKSINVFRYICKLLNINNE